MEESSARAVPPEADAVDPARRRAQIAARTARDNRATDVLVLDMRALTPVFDYFVVATGTSRRQLHAISDEIELALKHEPGGARLGIEGYTEGRWILVDFGDVVVHLFDPEARRYYALEDLWSTAVRVPLEGA
ncbi:MAG: ribosome silencing factor [Pirellulales bacterium]|nr:ribosome silencing factor [Pirellulales bacterium]